MNLETRVRNRIVLVTGASSGIGEALARRLGAAGARLVLVARSEDKLEALRQEIERAGGTASAITCDLSNAEDTQRLIDTVLSDYGHVDVLVNNAGMSIRRSVAKSYTRVHDFERTIALNFLGSVRLIMGFLPGMRANKRGHILNVSTIAVQVNVPRYGAYVASKAALDAFSRVVAVEALSDGVKVTTIYMPLVKTPMMEKTTIYDSIPMRTADEAAALIIDGIVRQPKQIATPVGSFFQLASGVVPGAVDRLLHAGHRLFPESGDKRDMDEKLSGRDAMLRQLFDLIGHGGGRRH